MRRFGRQYRNFVLFTETKSVQWLGNILQSAQVEKIKLIGSDLQAALVFCTQHLPAYFYIYPLEFKSFSCTQVAQIRCHVNC